MHTIAVLFVVAFSTRAVLSFFTSVNFSTPEQCGPFVVNFTGSTLAPVLPLSLTIVPISSNPISILLPADSWDNTSNAGAVRITFLPFSSGTQFVASIDDGTGASAGLVSDVIAVKDSNVTTCLPPKQKGTNFYDMHGDLTQCSRFNVTFDPSTIQRAPSVRAFLPRYFSFFVNATDVPLRTITRGGIFNGNFSGNFSNSHGNDKIDNSNENNNSYNNHNTHNISSKEYVLDVVHGFQAVLAFDDGEGHRESSRLFTAGGTSSSSSSCFKETFNMPSQTMEASSSAGSSPEGVAGLSRTGKIIVSVLGVSVVVSMAIILFILCRKRLRKRRDMENTSFVFTEDVDMGSSINSLASRIRTRISQLTSGKRSYRSYRDEKDEASAWVPTSPIGSVAPLSSWNASLPQSEKSLSWIDDKENRHFIDSGSGLSVLGGRGVEITEQPDSIILSNIGFITHTPSFPAEAHIHLSQPDVSMPVLSHSSRSSRFLLGSGYLSSRSSETVPTIQTNGFHGSISHLSMKLRRAAFGGGRRSSVVVLSSNLSSSGYMPSRSSSATPEPGDTGIYISSPIRPSLDLPRSTSPQSEADMTTGPSPLLPREVNQSISRPRMFRREGSRKDPGRALPFPTVSLRGSRASQQ